MFRQHDVAMISCMIQLKLGRMTLDILLTGSQNKMAGMGYPKNLEANSDGICYNIILEECHFCVILYKYGLEVRGLCCSSSASLPVCVFLQVCGLTSMWPICTCVCLGTCWQMPISFMTAVQWSSLWVTKSVFPPYVRLSQSLQYPLLPQPPSSLASENEPHKLT